MTTEPLFTLTPEQRRILTGHRSVTYAGIEVCNVAVSVDRHRIAVVVSTDPGHVVDLILNPADALELGLNLIAHARWAAAD